LLAYVPQFEGTILRGYKDPIGIVTACTGNTKSAILGKPYTKEECETLLLEDLQEHSEGVLSCVKRELTTGERAAAISFAFNVGVNAFCSSTMARKLAANDPTACAELSRWTKAGGKVLPGLVKRRAIERDICEGKIG
jgi:lysozyme